MTGNNKKQTERPLGAACDRDRERQWREALDTFQRSGSAVQRSIGPADCLCCRHDAGWVQHCSMGRECSVLSTFPRCNALLTSYETWRYCVRCAEAMKWYICCHVPVLRTISPTTTSNTTARTSSRPSTLFYLTDLSPTLYSTTHPYHHQPTNNNQDEVRRCRYSALRPRCVSRSHQASRHRHVSATPFR